MRHLTAVKHVIQVLQLMDITHIIATRCMTPVAPVIYNYIRGVILVIPIKHIIMLESLS